MNQLGTTQAAFSTPGIVLHLGKTGDSNRVVDVLSPEHGRLTLLARGARASKKRFAGILDVFATLNLHVQRSRGMWTLASADAHTTRLGIRRDFDAIMRAADLCKFVRAMVPQQEAAPEMFVALSAGLDACDRGDLLAAAAAYVPLAGAAGILPDLVCTACHQSHDRGMGLQRASGALICEQCDRRVAVLTPPTLASLAGAPPADTAVAAHLEHLMRELVALHTDRPQRRR